jgi:hypothetical protein
MRLLLFVLFSAITLYADDPSAVASPVPVPENLSIPARLSKTIDTKKCKAGDVVEMKTLEPVLITNGVVMPENTKLHGKIVGAASRQNEKPSWVLLVVQRAEWKEHSIPLHAFVAAQITIKAQVPGQNDNTFQGAIDMADIERRRRGTRTQTDPASDSAKSLGRPPRDATVERNDGLELSYHGVNDLLLMKDNNGRVFLVSQKAHLKLPSGTMLMLHNRPTAAATQAASPKAADRAQ